MAEVRLSFAFDPWSLFTLFLAGATFAAFISALYDGRWAALLFLGISAFCLSYHYHDIPLVADRGDTQT